MLLTLLGAGAQLVGTGLSFAQAAREKREMEQANREAAKSMLEAKRRLDVNVYDELAIAKEPYELEREQMLMLGASALQQGVEGSARGAAATAGRVQMATGQAAAQTRANMSKELRELEKLSAAEEGRLADMGMGISLEQVEGAQEAARLAELRRQQAIASGVKGIGGAFTTLMQDEDIAPLFKKQGTEEDPFSKALKEGMGLSSITGVGSEDLKGVGDAYEKQRLAKQLLSGLGYDDFKKRLTD